MAKVGVMFIVEDVCATAIDIMEMLVIFDTAHFTKTSNATSMGSATTIQASVGVYLASKELHANDLAQRRRQLSCQTSTLATTIHLGAQRTYTIHEASATDIRAQLVSLGSGTGLIVSPLMVKMAACLVEDRDLMPRLDTRMLVSKDVCA